MICQGSITVILLNRDSRIFGLTILSENYLEIADNHLFTAHITCILNKSVIDHQMNYKCNIQSILQCLKTCPKQLVIAVNVIKVFSIIPYMHHIDYISVFW